MLGMHDAQCGAALIQSIARGDARVAANVTSRTMSCLFGKQERFWSRVCAYVWHSCSEAACRLMQWRVCRAARVRGPIVSFATSTPCVLPASLRDVA